MRMHTIAFLIAITAAACTPSTPEATPTQMPWPTPEPVQLSIEMIEVELLSEDPIALEGPDGQPLHFASPPISDGHAIHAIAIEIIDYTTNPGEDQAPPTFLEHNFYHIASPDGLEWAVETEPLVFEVQDEFDPGLPVDQTENRAWLSSHFIHLEQLPDETWRIFLVRRHFSQLDAGTLWSMTAPEISGPWTMDNGPLLTGNPGEWDEGGLLTGSIFSVGHAYYLYYTIPYRSAIGMAVSADGTNWEKSLPYGYDSPVARGTNMIFEFDPNQDWGFSPIWHSDSGWWMIYAPMVVIDEEAMLHGPGEYQVAWSSEGIRWEAADVAFHYPETGISQGLGSLILQNQELQGCWWVSISFYEPSHCYWARLIAHPRQ